MINGYDINKISTELSTKGFIYINRQCSLDFFYKISSQLGNIRSESDVKIVEKSNLKYLSINSLQFHNDIPYPGYIAWYRVDAPIFEEPTYLIDCEDIVQQFTVSDLEVLAKIKIKVRNEPDQSLISYYDGKLKIYMIPWAISSSSSDAEFHLLSLFYKYIQSKIDNSRIPILLNQGEILIIDDTRVLHGRGVLNPNSERWLKRLWIEKI